MSRRITAFTRGYSHGIIPPLLPLLSYFSPLDPILHLAAPAWLSHSVSMMSHWLLYLLQWCLSLGLPPFPWLSIPGELQVSSVELSTPAPPLSLPGWIGAGQHPPVWTKVSEVTSKALQGLSPGRDQSSQPGGALPALPGQAGSGLDLSSVPEGTAVDVS